MYHIPLAFQYIYGCSDERNEDGDRKNESEILEDGREWRLPGFLYADDFVLCG